VGNGHGSGRHLGRRAPELEVGEEPLLGDGDGLGADGGDLRGSVGLVDGAFSFGRKEGAVALRVCVALRNGCGDVGGAAARLSGRDGRRTGYAGCFPAARTVSGEPVGDLLLECGLLLDRGLREVMLLVLGVGEIGRLGPGMVSLRDRRRGGLFAGLQFAGLELGLC